MNILKKIDLYAVSKRNIIACTGLLDDQKEKLTYEKLKDYSDILAFYLQTQLGENKSPIVVYGHKNPFMLVCFLACVKSGRAYCPVDVSVPTERVKDIIKESGSPLILTTESLDLNSENIINLEDIKKIINAAEGKICESYYVKNDDVFYIIFTSGSTGKPKGVQITENCLCNFVKWAITLGDKNLENRQLSFINQAPFSFDLSVMDLYMSLYLGGTLWCLEKPVQSDYNLLFESLKKSDANVWVSTPSFANMCLAGEAFAENLMNNIELFLFCGETLTNQTAAELNKRFPNAVTINTYGPTESTVAVTSVLVSREISEKYTPLPVGKPKNGTYLFIEDENGQVLPEGEKGEIVIAGDSVSTGYLGRSDLNEKAFSIREIGGVAYRSYKTGDEGYIQDSYLFYCGRIDLQIKLHGYRIEIEDIENNLMKLKSIKSAAVVPVVKSGAAESLAAFVIPNFKAENNLKSVLKIKQELSEFLPSYMIPKKILFKETLPMTSNGKADRKKLLEEL